MNPQLYPIAPKVGGRRTRVHILMRPIAVLAALVLAGCSSPGLSTNIGIGPNGISVTPVATAKIAGARVSVRP
jgi:hypothetical protein